MSNSENLQSELLEPYQPIRKPWGAFPDVLISETNETEFRQHPRYADAKAGDRDAAYDLVMDYMTDSLMESLQKLVGSTVPVIVAVHAVEGVSTNVIPEVFAGCLSGVRGWPVDDDIVQLNRVGHTKSSGFHRLATPAIFGGAIQPGASYLLVDDFIGQGGTLANLKGYIEQNGGKVVASVVLAGKPYSAKLSLLEDTLEELRRHHGNLEDEWRAVFGYGFDFLTESEARYLIRTPDAERIRSNVLEAAKAGNRVVHP